MQFTVPGAQLAGLDTGAQADVVCWSHGLLWSHAMYAPQIEALRGTYRCVAWDHRGQGASTLPPGRAVSIEAITTDAIHLIEGLGVGPVHFVGLSMGGFVGMRVAARRPDLVRSLALLETAPDREPDHSARRYRSLNLAARLFGVPRWLAARVMHVMFSPAFLDDPARADDRHRFEAMLRSNTRSIHKAVTGVLERESVEHELSRIRCPTLVLRGTGDAAISRERARLCADGIEGSTWVEVEGAGHTSTLEQPAAVTEVIARHLAAATP